MINRTDPYSRSLGHLISEQAQLSNIGYMDRAAVIHTCETVESPALWYGSGQMERMWALVPYPCLRF